jgi:hypothetical protein
MRGTFQAIVAVNGLEFIAVDSIVAGCDLIVQNKQLVSA